MAEFAVFGVLQLYKQGKFFLENQNCRKWEKHRGLIELFGKNVCIVGCGSVGTECAKRFSAMGCSVIGIDVLPREDECYHTMYSLDALDEVLAYSDIVILTLPLTLETKYLINKDVFNKMKKGSALVNIARGAIVDTEVLTEALKNKLFGAVLDVFEDEPLLLDSPLWDMENVIVTPHNSFVGDGNSERLFNLIYSNLESMEK